MKAIQPKIIIINNCNDCPYAQYGGLGVICRKLKEIGKYDVPYDMDDCPLRPLPSFKAVDLNDTRDVIMFCHGWNACRGEIEE